MPFFVALHLGTAAALLVSFRREWAVVFAGFFRSLRTEGLWGDRGSRPAWLLAAGLIYLTLLLVS